MSLESTRVSADDLDDPPRRSLRLHAVGGLANRLRAILSYRSKYRSLEVIWDADEYVSCGRWLDVFEPLNDVHFVSGGWDIEDFAPCRSAPLGWEDAYCELQASPGVLERVLEHRRLIGGAYVAIHIRRTDHVPNAALCGIPLEPIGDFVAWRRQWPHAPLPVWLATDNEDTRREFCKLTRALPCFHGPRIGGSVTQALEDHHRNGSLADAVVDLAMCAGANHFMGTAGSSFSDTIRTIRRLNALDRP